MYRWVVFLHVVGGFLFVVSHGASAAVSFKLRKESEPRRIQALLEVSSSTFFLMYAALLLILASGITAGFIGFFWRQIWIWAALGLLIAMMVAMYVLASSYYAEVRKAAGLPNYAGRKESPAEEPRSPEELAAILRSSIPITIAVIGIVGFLAIVWLMVLKPF